MNDRELIINGKAVCSPEQQVYKNMKDIETLQKIIKTTYKTSSALTSSSASDSTANTNVGTAKEGWLMTEDGLLFRIDGNDGTTLLLTYYADLKGPQGETGPSGDPTALIDDTGTANNKCWSSNKTNTMLNTLNADEAVGTGIAPSHTKGYSQNIINGMVTNAVFYTTVAPTLNDGVYYVTDTNISPLERDIRGVDCEVTPVAGDIIMYIDNDGNIDSLWKILSSVSLSVTKIGSISGGGSQLYQHNIKIFNTNYGQYYINLTIVNDNNSQFGSAFDLYTWLIAKGFEYKDNEHHWFNAYGNWSYGGDYYDVVGIEWNENASNIKFHGISKDGASTQNGNLGTTSTYIDDVIPL